MPRKEKIVISTEEAMEKVVKRDRYLGILWEKIDDKFSIVIEGNNMLERKIDHVDHKLEDFRAEANEKFDMLFGEVKRIDGLESRFDGLESRFDGLKHRFDGFESRFDGFENRIDGLESRFDGFENRLGVLGGGVKQLLNDNQEFFGELRAVKADVAALDRRVTTGK